MKPAFKPALLTEYAFGWCLHQLAPFLDKAFGVAGAMDHRMIDRPYDWYVRLPLVLLVAVLPRRNVMLAAHVVNIVCWWDRMPAVWDYMCWCALMELTFVGAALLSSTSEDTAARFLPAVRAQLLVLYYSAAFWKLTSSWFDPHYSCSTVLMSELLAGLEPLLPLPAPLSSALMVGAPFLVAGIEFAVPAFLLLYPRWGVALALIFHQTINLMPATYAGGFSIAMCARLLIFLPGFGTALWSPRLPLVSVGLVALAIGLMLGVHGEVDFHGGIFIFLALLYFLAISAEPSAETRALPPPAAYALPKMLAFVALSLYGTLVSVGASFALLALWSPVSLVGFARRSVPGLAGAAVLVGFVYGFLGPIAGVQMMAASTMYGNVKNFGGSNHLLVPTGLLQDMLADPAAAAAAPSFLSDFGDGLVRVERTTSTAFLQVAVNGADTTDELPPRSRALLSEFNASGRYFQFYAARNYYDRPGDLQATALNDIKSDGAAAALPDPPYVVPAYELRRMLQLARERAEPFVLEYTRLPPALRTASEWKAHRGPAVVYKEPKAGEPSCVVRSRGVADAACGGDELVMAPPPQRWTTKILLPYPFPLLPGAGDGVHCST